MFNIYRNNKVKDYTHQLKINQQIEIMYYVCAINQINKAIIKKKQINKAIINIHSDLVIKVEIKGEFL